MLNTANDESRDYTRERGLVLGVATNAPAYTLDVNGVIRGKSDIYLTKGSSPFIGNSDNFDLRFGVNLGEILRLTTTGRTETAGGLISGDYIRAEGYSTPPTGEGVEIGYSSGQGFVSAYKRTDSTYKPLILRGTSIALTSTNGIFTVDATGALSHVYNSTASNATVNASLFYHRTNATPTVGFGFDYYTQLASSTNTDRAAMLQRVTWATATDASRKARVDYFMFDTTNRLALRMETNGSAAMIGFLGTSAVVRQNITGTLTAATLAQLTTVVSNRVYQGLWYTVRSKTKGANHNATLCQRTR